MGYLFKHALLVLWFQVCLVYLVRMSQNEASLSRRAALLVGQSAGSLRFRVQLRTASAVACCPICPGPLLLTVWGYIWPVAQVSQSEYWQEERVLR